MTKRDKIILGGLAIGAAVAIWQQMSTASHYKQLEANAIHKAVPGGLKNAFNVSPSSEMNVTTGIPSATNAETAPAQTQETPPAPSRPQSPTIATEPLTPREPAATQSLPAISPASLATQPTLPPPPPAPESAPLPVSAPPSKPMVAMVIQPSTKASAPSCEATQSYRSLHMRYGPLLFRIGLNNRLDISTNSLAPFFNRAQETLSIANGELTCTKKTCYVISRELIDEATQTQASVRNYACTDWQLVTDKKGPNCDFDSEIKTLHLARASSESCVVGTLEEIRTFNLPSDFSATLPSLASSRVYLTERQPASTPNAPEKGASDE